LAELPVLEAQKARFPAPGAAEYRSEAGGVNPNGRFALGFGRSGEEQAMKLDGVPIGAVD